MRLGKKRGKFVESNYDGPMADDDDLSVGSTSTADDERIIYFSGEVSELSVGTAVAAMFSMAQKSAKPIYLVVDTYGGSVDSMFALYDAIKFVTCPVHTIAMGKVMSAGVLILAAGEKGHRMIAPHARVMTHNAWTVLSGNVFEVEHELTELKRLEQLWEDAMVRETGRSPEEIHTLNDRHLDLYLTPQDCVTWGIADSLLYDINTVGIDRHVQKKSTKVRAKKKRTQR